jgi:alkanesulfonate monooxygenase SsuD/methylene tetrahydromethanopterin reductase-like flavin-dependent oxidoreductase (luciferase family)
MPVMLRAAASPDTDTSTDASADARPLFAGDPARWADDLAEVAALGVGHVFVQFDPGVGVDATLETLAQVIARVDR